LFGVERVGHEHQEQQEQQQQQQQLQLQQQQQQQHQHPTLSPIKMKTRFTGFTKEQTFWRWEAATQLIPQVFANQHLEVTCWSFTKDL